MSDLELHYWSHVPDEVDGDNILVSGGCALEEAFFHSYKLAWDRKADTFTHLTGSGPTVIAETPRLARNASKEGDFDQVREHLARAIHVATDLTTVWHLTRELGGDLHEEGEAAVAKVVRKVLPAKVEPLLLPKAHSLLQSQVRVSEDTLRAQLDRVRAAQAAKGGLGSDPALVAEMVERCCAWSLTVVGYAWRLVERSWG